MIKYIKLSNSNIDFSYCGIRQVDVMRTDPLEDNKPDVIVHLSMGTILQIVGKEAVTDFLDQFESPDIYIIDYTKENAPTDGEDNYVEQWTSSGDTILRY